MPLFPEESWYFCQVRKYAVDGRFGETKRKMELEKIDNLLAEVISKKDFPRPFQVLCKFKKLT